MDYNLDNFLQYAPDATIIANAEGVIVATNIQFENLFGYNNEEIKGKLVEILLPERLQQIHAEHRHRFGLNPHFRYPMGADQTIPARHKDGHTFPVEVALSGVPSDGGTLHAATIRDATPRWQTETFLKNRWKWLIACVVFMHLIQGALLVFDATAGNTTSTASVMQLIPVGHSLAGLIILATACLSIYELVMNRHVTFFIPQFLLLVIGAFGAAEAITQSAFADGVIRSRSFIAADQSIYIVLALIYGIALLEIYLPRVAAKLRGYEFV